MVFKNLSHFVQSSNTAWKISRFSGIQYMALHSDLNEKEGSFLIKMAPHSTYPKHRHGQEEELFFLHGSATVGSHLLNKGDFLFSPPGSVHEVFTQNGCVFLMRISAPLEFISSGEIKEMDETQFPNTSDVAKPQTNEEPQF